jgi:hypothetical protein
VTKRISARTREQVVELLRCAADLCALDHDQGLGRACELLDAKDHWDLAYDARIAAKCSGPTEYLYTCLEAAQRVEEGSYP